ncbi:hypothetical protein C0993_001111, partial [Termitomyces sp. T159_Od127]
ECFPDGKLIQVDGHILSMTHQVIIECLDARLGIVHSHPEGFTSLLHCHRIDKAVIQPYQDLLEGPIQLVPVHM